MIEKKIELMKVKFFFITTFLISNAIKVRNCIKKNQKMK
jgi:hypothetical protein